MLLNKINGKFYNQDILSLDQFDTGSIFKLFKLAKQIKRKKNKNLNYLKGKLVALIFYEPSTRTFSSFCAAVKRLGGQTIEYQNPLQTSSAIKGETLEDSTKVFETYSDAIVMRHPEIGSAKRASIAAEKVPIINAGDGVGEHPTQALLDLFTIYEKFGRLDNLVGLITGDLLYGRTVHSLLKGLSYSKNNKVYLLSPKHLKIPHDLYQSLSKNGLKLIKIESEKDIPANADFWYWTRVQKERFSNLKEYEKVKNRFVIDKNLLIKYGNKKMIIMHPLPRVGEIKEEVDSDPRALYLRDQIQNGVYVRMALLSLVIGNKK